jgi:hypothetical protein
MASEEGPVKQTGTNIRGEEHGNVSIFEDIRGFISLAVTSCFMPTKP